MTRVHQQQWYRWMEKNIPIGIHSVFGLREIKIEQTYKEINQDLFYFQKLGEVLQDSLPYFTSDVLSSTI